MCEYTYTHRPTELKTVSCFAGTHSDYDRVFTTLQKQEISGIC